MGRRKKGRDISGWLIVDKPAGVSSAAVVNKVRWAFDAKKAGHAGTLDPEATGILAIALGEATKTIPYVTDSLKAYEFTMRLGQATNTDDAEGVVTRQSSHRPSDAEIKNALGKFVGNIQQVPPAFSAVKIDGERAYKMAREGIDVDIAARPLWVESLLLIDRPSQDYAVLELVCGKGGYVRSIARDLGEALGCHGHVSTLRRIWSGPFNMRDSVHVDLLDKFSKTPELDKFLKPLEVGLQGIPNVVVSKEAVSKLRNGNPAMVVASELQYGDECWGSFDGEPIAIGIYRAGELHPTRVFVGGEA
jgi:tRNA pseudouridine55 synthase